MNDQHPILVGDRWVESAGTATFHATNPATSALLPDLYPVSVWQDCEHILDIAQQAFTELQEIPAEQLAEFLTSYAALLNSDADAICQTASLETGLAVSPRLKDVELMRTTSQLRQASAALLDGSWRLATIDTQHHLRSMYRALGPVVVFGPNNFPLAFNAIAGGDFAAAIAAGNPVIAKAHPLHPSTTRLMAELAAQAASATRLPPGTVQLIYHLEREDGLRLVADRRVGAVGFTGSRQGGLAIKSACDAVGKPVFLEMSSLNPVVMLPGALRERCAELITEFSDSCLLAAGQMCTNPGLILVIQNDDSLQWLQGVAEQLLQRPAGILFSAGGRDSLHRSVQAVIQAGAKRVVGGEPLPEPGFRYANTLLTCTASQFVKAPEQLQTEMFGSASLVVFATDAAELLRVIDALDGNLTGSIYAARDQSDNEMYRQVAQRLAVKVGRLNNDKMPTGVVVSPAMCHGGPYPSTGHPGFTAVGIPASIRRFAMLQCYDRVSDERLPVWLRNANPNGRCWRWIEDRWTTDDVAVTG